MGYHFFQFIPSLYFRAFYRNVMLCDFSFLLLCSYFCSFAVLKADMIHLKMSCDKGFICPPLTKRYLGWMAAIHGWDVQQPFCVLGDPLSYIYVFVLGSLICKTQDM